MKGFSPFHQEEKKVIAHRMMEAKRMRKPTYKEAWDNMSKEEKAKHGSYEAFKKAAIEYNVSNE